jgi:Calcineurin-like phosphoesterase.
MKNIFIGDVHGAYSGLKKLLSESNYQSSDRLWFVGDLVNRGSESLDVLKFIADLGDKANVVLGNHDVHMLGVYYGARDYGHKDTFDDVLTHHDAERYIRFMMTRPFAHTAQIYLS